MFMLDIIAHTCKHTYLLFFPYITRLSFVLNYPVLNSTSYLFLGGTFPYEAFKSFWVRTNRHGFKYRLSMTVFVSNEPLSQYSVGLGLFGLLHWGDGSPCGQRCIFK